jgi:hypothetical protein
VTDKHLKVGNIKNVESHLHEIVIEKFLDNPENDIEEQRKLKLLTASFHKSLSVGLKYIWSEIGTTEYMTGLSDDEFRTWFHHNMLQLPTKAVYGLKKKTCECNQDLSHDPYHAFTCNKFAGKRTVIHDKIVEVLINMVKKTHGDARRVKPHDLMINIIDYYGKRSKTDVQHLIEKTPKGTEYDILIEDQSGNITILDVTTTSPATFKAQNKPFNSSHPAILQGVAAEQAAKAKESKYKDFTPKNIVFVPFAIEAGGVVNVKGHQWLKKTTRGNAHEGTLALKTIAGILAREFSNLILDVNLNLSRSMVTETRKVLLEAHKDFIPDEDHNNNSYIAHSDGNSNNMDAATYSDKENDGNDTTHPLGHHRTVTEVKDMEPGECDESDKVSSGLNNTIPLLVVNDKNPPGSNRIANTKLANTTNVGRYDGNVQLPPKVPKQHETNKVTGKLFYPNITYSSLEDLLTKVRIQHGFDFSRYTEVVRKDPSFAKVIAGIIHPYGVEAILVSYSMPLNLGTEIHLKIDSIVEEEKDLPPEDVKPRRSLVNGYMMVKEIYDFLIENNPVEIDHATLSDNLDETPKTLGDKSPKLGQSTSQCTAENSIPSYINLNTNGNQYDHDLSSISEETSSVNVDREEKLDTLAIVMVNNNSGFSHDQGELIYPDQKSLPFLTQESDPVESLDMDSNVEQDHPRKEKKRRIPSINTLLFPNPLHGEVNINDNVIRKFVELEDAYSLIKDPQKNDKVRALKVESVRTLTDERWLNDEIIHYILMRIQNSIKRQSKKLFKIFDPLFYDQLTKTDSGQLKYNFDRVPTYLLKDSGNILEYKKLFFPMHVDGNHWILVLVDLDENYIVSVDSLNKANSVHIENIKSLIKDLRSKGEKEDASTPMITKAPHPDWKGGVHQFNGHQCGVHLIMNVYRILQNSPMDNIDGELDKVRTRLYNMVINDWWRREHPSITMNTRSRTRDLGSVSSNDPVFVESQAKPMVQRQGLRSQSKSHGSLSAAEWDSL